MKWYFTFLFSIFFLVNGYSQITWDTKINYETTDLLDTNPGLLKTQDGNYLFLYWRYDDPPIQNNSLTHALAKYNTSGELLWEKTYDQWEYTTPGSNSNQPYGMVEMPNGNILIAGRVFGGPPSYSDAVLYLISSDGDSLLFRSYPEYDLFRKITVQYNNTISVVGYNSNNNNFFILKINATTGDIIEVNPATYHARNDEAFFPKNSSYYVHFTTFSDSIQLKKYSLSNDLLLSNSFSYPEGFGLGNSFFSGVAYNESINSDKVVIYNSALLEFDENLSPTLQIPFSTTSLNPANFILDWHESKVIIPTSDGGYVMSALKTPSGTQSTATVFFIKVDAQGNEEWIQSFSNWELPANYIPYMIEEPDGYVFISHAYFNERIYLTKMTKTGQLVRTKNLESDTAIKIYPNPVDDFVNINTETNAEFEVTVYNTVGKIMASNIFYRSIELNTNHLEGGVYFLKITNKKSKESIQKKIVVQ